jgi:hypothetical protein
LRPRCYTVKVHVSRISTGSMPCPILTSQAHRLHKVVAKKVSSSPSVMDHGCNVFDRDCGRPGNHGWSVATFWRAIRMEGMLLWVRGIYVVLKGSENLLRWIVEPASCGVRMQRPSDDASCASLIAFMRWNVLYKRSQYR